MMLIGLQLLYHCKLKFIFLSLDSCPCKKTFFMYRLKNKKLQNKVARNHKKQNPSFSFSVQTVIKVVGGIYIEFRSMPSPRS
jgi:hypothetical protein